MANYFEHKTDVFPLVVDTSLANCDPVNIGIYANGRIAVPTGSSITTLTFYACDNVNGTFLQIFDSAAAISMTVSAGNTYQLPAAVMGYTFIKVKANVAGGVQLYLST